MSEQDVRDLWSAVNGLRTGFGDLRTDIKAGISRIETVVTERCSARLKRIEALEAEHKAHDTRLDRLEHFMTRTLVVGGLGALIGGAAVGGAVTWAFRVFGS